MCDSRGAAEKLAVNEQSSLQRETHTFIILRIMTLHCVGINIFLRPEVKSVEFF